MQLIDAFQGLINSLAASTGLAAVIFELIFVVVILVVLVIGGYFAGKSVGGAKESSATSKLLIPSEGYSVDESISIDEVTQTQETLQILEVEKTSATQAIKSAEKAYKSKKISPSAYQKLMELYSERLEKINSEISRRTSVVKVGTLEAEFERARQEALVELKGEPEEVTEPGVPEVGLIEESEVLEGPEAPTAPPTAPPAGPPTAPPTAPPAGPPTAPPTAPPAGPPTTPPPTTAPPATPTAPGEDLVDAGMATVASLRSEMLNELRRLKKYMQKPPA